MCKQLSFTVSIEKDNINQIERILRVQKNTEKELGTDNFGVPNPIIKSIKLIDPIAITTAKSEMISRACNKNKDREHVLARLTQ